MIPGHRTGCRDRRRFGGDDHDGGWLEIKTVGDKLKELDIDLAGCRLRCFSFILFEAEIAGLVVLLER